MSISPHSDMRQVAKTVMSHHGALAGSYRPQASEIAVITPHNIPGD